MAYTDKHGTFFGRSLDEYPHPVTGETIHDGIAILHVEDGSAATRLDATGVYPIGSDLGVRHEHAAGIVLRKADAERLGIELED